MDLSYTVIKSNRKSYSIRITDDNKIIVRAPLNSSQRDVEKLIASKRQWIEKVTSFNDGNALNTADIAAMRSAYVNGTAVPVIVGGRNFIDGSGVHIATYNSFKAAYVNGAGSGFLSKFDEVQQLTGLKAKSVNFRSYKSRWGCCDGDDNIVFNFKLMMLPVNLQYYVMVHELCHTVYHNHSKQFWQLVKKILPDYAKLRKQLKNYNFLVKMY